MKTPKIPDGFLFEYFLRGFLIFGFIVVVRMMLNMVVPVTDQWWGKLFENYVDKKFLVWGFSILPTLIFIVFLGWLTSLPAINTFLIVALSGVPVINVASALIFGVKVNGSTVRISFSDIRKSIPALAELYIPGRLDACFILEKKLMIGGEEPFIIVFFPTPITIFPGHGTLIDPQYADQRIKMRFRPGNVLGLLLFAATSGFAHPEKLEKL